MTHSTEPNEFSFDLYPGLDAELEAAYQRNVAHDHSPTEIAAAAGMAAVVGEALHKKAETIMTQEAEVWAVGSVVDAMQKWQNYTEHDRGSIFDGFDTDGKLVEATLPTLDRLYEAKQALETSGELTPDGKPISETMELVAVPWQAFKDHLHDLPGWLQRLRSTQQITEPDFINSELLSTIQNGTPMYIDWDNRGGMLSAQEYLDKKIDTDGRWGFMLVQTSNDAGVQAWRGQSPNDMTDDGERSPVIAGQQVANLGIFEWLATTLQEDPTQLSSQDLSWLIANRFTDASGVAQVPYGGWYGVQVKSNLYSADNRGDDIRPRLAVK